jgi:AcrR family transcriptional regulator
VVVPAAKKISRNTTPDRILNAALKAYLRRGYEGTSIADIAEASRLTEETLYGYFKGRREIFLLLLEKTREQVIEPVIEKIAHAPNSAQAKLVAYVHGISSVAVTRADYLMFLIVITQEFHESNHPLRQEIEDISQHFKRSLEGIIKLGWMQGRFRSDLGLNELVAIVSGAMNGVLMEWYRRRDELRGRDLVRAIRLVLLRGLDDVMATETLRLARRPLPGHHP